MDTLVFDIETSNFFTSPGVGWNNFDALRISCVGIYSYAANAYLCFEEREMDRVAELFRTAGKIVGFSINRYDVPVLDAYFRRLFPGENLLGQEKVDLLEEIEMATGHRISLNLLAEANLGLTKTNHPSEAITLFAEGRMEELKAYCLKDVELTKKLYDLYRAQDHLLIPSRDGGAPEKALFVGRHDLLGKETRPLAGETIL